MKYKDYKIDWKGDADNQQVVQAIYTLFSKPTDRYNDTVFPSKNPPEEPLHSHLRYLLGPKIGQTGNWADGKSTLATRSGIPESIQLGIRTDAVAKHRPGESCGNPWNILTDPRPPETGGGGICDDFARLMLEALSVAGTPAEKLDVRDVVGLPVVERPTLFGQKPPGGGNFKLTRGFYLQNDPNRRWLNEGVCGIKTDDAKGEFRYYDIVATTKIGYGGWAKPNERGTDDNPNLWYFPKDATDAGPIIRSPAEGDYGFWIPVDKARPEAWDLSTRPAMPALALAAVTLLKPMGFRLNYRTEGIPTQDANGKNFIVKAIITENVAGKPVQVLNTTANIKQQWDNLQSFDFVTNAAKPEVLIQISVLDPKGNAYAGWGTATDWIRLGN